ncbi:MAG: TIGR01212 family radical SAM protein [Clostridia bacterium]|nr:TIGR01212 family radical SAM protein [Clostridia bacterium]
MEKRYNKLNEYYKEKFGERTLKICVDGGFTCPNRDGICGTGGCIFCSEKGSGELIKQSNESITKQVKDYLNSYRAKRANKFIVYFQNFSNTYDTLENLKEKYDSSLIDDRIVGLSIATRPDCINEDIAKLIKSYSNNYYVCVELGLQTASDEIGQIINRGYTTKQFVEAVKILNKYEIDVIAHIMCGLPGENRDGENVPIQIKETVDLVNSHNIHGIKIHSTYVVKNTLLAEMCEKGEYIPLELDEYFEDLTYIITHLNPNIVIHRICADAPKDILVAPDWNAHKKWVLNGFEKILKEEDLWQGKFYIKK